jgi:cytochrome P450
LIETVIEVLLLALLIWPLMRVGLSRPFRRKLRVFPRIGAILLTLLIAYAGGVLLAVLFAPVLLRGMAAVAAGGIVYTRWRARPEYRCSSGLPPGSLSLAPTDPWRNDLFYLEQAARYGPVFKVSNYVQPMVCVVGLSRAGDLLREHENALTVAPLPFSRFIPQGFLRYMPPAPHRVYRDLFRKAFSGEVVRGLEPYIRRVMQAELAGLARVGELNGVTPQPHLLRLVQTTFLRVFFGLPDDAPATPRMRELYSIIDYQAAYRTRPAAVRRALSEMTEVLEAQVAEYREPGPGGLSDSFLGRLVAADPALAADPTVIGNLLYISQSTANDVSELLTWILKMLSDHPEWADRLRDELHTSEVPSAESRGSPPAVGSTSLAERIVTETLRLEQSEYVMRQALEDLTWKGFVIPRGWQIRICVRESHRDPNIFEAPDVFDPDRHKERTHGPNELAPFGLYGMACLGVPLTRAVARIFVTELVRDCEWTVIEDGPREFGGFHWRPSSGFRVRLGRRV